MLFGYLPIDLHNLYYVNIQWTKLRIFFIVSISKNNLFFNIYVNF